MIFQDKIKELEKGCGKVEFGSYTKCGKVSSITKKKVICNPCKAKLQTLKEDQEEVNKKVEGLKEYHKNRIEELKEFDGLMECELQKAEHIVSLEVIEKMFGEKQK